jgi:RHS repeat-associated protein
MAAQSINSSISHTIRFPAQKEPSTGDSSNIQSGTSDDHKIPALTLPTGGGAIRGIDEKFRVNPANGSGTMTIPIATSPARQGFGPQLALSYDSGSGNGPFGMGWNLSLSRITRKTDKGLPTYQDNGESDVFILSGAEDLVPVLVNDNGELTRHRQSRTLDDIIYLVRRYRPRVEGLFARIERWTSQQTGEVHWRSITRDNVTTLYGRTMESRIADPDDPLRIFSWLICESYDDKGNAIIYRYKSEDSANVNRSRVHERNRTELSRSADRYLKRIHYGNRTPRLPGENLHERTDWMFEVVFDYGEGHLQLFEENHDEGRRFVESAIEEQLPWPVRQDPLSSYRAGFEVRTYRLCRRILLFHHFPDELEVDDYLVRATHLGYTESPINTEMTHVIQSGYLLQEDGSYLERTLPPVEFEYSRAEIQSEVHEIDIDSLENLPVGLSGSFYRLVDLDGEGISGILTEQGGGWFYKSNLGNARFGPQEKIAAKPSLAALNNGQQFLDLAGDGQLDLVMLDAPGPGFYERTHDRSWSDHKAFVSLPSLDWNDPNLRFVDLTGDGHADLLVTEDRVFTWYPSLAEDGYGPSLRTSQSDDDEIGPRLVFSDATQSVYLADMSGDGLTDLVRLRNGLVCYWPNLGYGYFGAKVTMDNAPWFDAPDMFDQQRIRLGDVDASGITDILYIQHDRIAIYFNEAGNGWTDARFIDHFPGVDNLSDVTVTDLLGNFTACLVWSSPLPGDEGRHMRYIDLMGGVKPHLMIGSSNNLGAESRVNYAASTKFYLEDKASGNPWITRLPFPVHVVERVETYDHISRNRFVTRYRYHHGFFDGIEREFHGFGMVEQWDTEQFAILTAEGTLSEETANLDNTSHVPPVHTRTWFHTGPYLDREHISLQFENEYYREPGLTDDEFRALLLPDTTLPPGLSIEEEREACRALKGMMLRQEVYADDAPPGSTEEAIQRARTPYTVVEQDFTIRLLQPRAGYRHAVFFTHPRESITYHYERNPDDPRIQHALTLEVDDYGNVLKEAAIGYGRRHADETLVPDDRNKQQQMLMTTTEHDFTNAIEEEDVYRSPIPGEVRTYEITGLEPSEDQVRISFFQFHEAFEAALEMSYHMTPIPGVLQKRLLEQTRILYRRDDLSGPLPLGHMQSLALPFESYQLAFTPEHLDLVFGDRVNETILSVEGRYVHFNGDDNWWIPSGRVFLSPHEADDSVQELAFAREHFFLPLRFQDPFGQTGTIQYDHYDLLGLETRDPLDNTVTAGERGVDGTIIPRLDYRVLQPELITDPNGNRSVVAFDILGMVAGTALTGKPGENVGEPLEDFLANFEPNPSWSDIDNFFADPRGPSARLLLGNATSRNIYDESRYHRLEQPPFAAAIMRETHVSDLGTNDETAIQVSLTYSDGFGRIIQSIVQAGPGPVEEGEEIVDPRWVGSGWTIFNNKGDPIKQYEPFFSDDHEFQFGAIVGVSPTLFYDPVGRNVATLYPNHTWEKVVFDPWRQETWDINDTVLLNPAEDTNVGDFFRRLAEADYLPTWHALRTDPANSAEAALRWPDPQQRSDQGDAAAKAAAHADTSGIVYLDALGRPFLSLDDNGVDDLFETRTEQDIEGATLRVIDARGNPVMEYVVTVNDGNNQFHEVTGYDVAGRELYENSMDGGERWVLADVAGNLIRAWDSRGHAFRTEYDPLRRPLCVFVTGTDPDDSSREFLTDLSVYGEQHSQAEEHNMRGAVYLQLDQAGAARSEAYDFKGNLLRASRRLASEYKRVIDWTTVDDELPDEATTLFDPDTLEESLMPFLETEIFTTRTEYDALNRPITITTPDNSVHLPAYNEAGLLERMEVRLRGAAQATLFVADIDYNAKGQRQRIEHGNGVITAYSYDFETFRLTRLESTRPAFPPGQRLLQDLHYAYDPAGNITSIRDFAQQTIFFDNSMVEPHCDYTYDALYRLIRAEGREHAAQNNIQRDAEDFFPIIGIPFPNSPEALQQYTEEYEYDGVGNIMSFTHIGGASLRWKRCYQYAQDSNRLLGTSSAGEFAQQLCPVHYVPGPDSALSGQYEYDLHGNMTSMPHLPLMRWDFRDQLQASAQQVVNNGGTPETTWYVYDAAGQRVRKVTERQAAPGQSPTRRNERIYLGGFERYREYNGNGNTVTLERQTLHVMDDQQRIARIDTRTLGNDGSPAQSRRYQLSNHLGSASVMVDEQANVISYEEYHPYGTTAYLAGRSAAEVSLKRYRYTGREKDEETGLYYHGARYYACWLGRWTAADPIGVGDGVNRYAYVHGNPVTMQDQWGMKTDDPMIAQEAARLQKQKAGESLHPYRPDSGNATPYEGAELSQGMSTEPPSEVEESKTEKDNISVLFLRFSDQNQGDFWENIKAYFGQKSITEFKGRPSKRTLLKHLRNADVVVISGHHWVESGEEPGSFHSKPISDGDYRRGVNLTEVAKLTSEPLSERTKLIFVTGCNTCRPKSLDFFRKEFPNATIIGWGTFSQKHSQESLTERFSENLPLMLFNHIGHQAQLAWYKTISELVDEYNQLSTRTGLTPDEKKRRGTLEIMFRMKPSMYHSTNSFTGLERFWQVRKRGSKYEVSVSQHIPSLK